MVTCLVNHSNKLETVAVETHSRSDLPPSLHANNSVTKSHNVPMNTGHQINVLNTKVQYKPYVKCIQKCFTECFLSFGNNTYNKRLCLLQLPTLELRLLNSD